MEAFIAACEARDGLHLNLRKILNGEGGLAGEQLFDEGAPVPRELVHAPLVKGLNQPLPASKVVVQRRLIALPRGPQNGPRGHRPEAFRGKERFRRIKEPIARLRGCAAPGRRARHGETPH